MKIKEDISIKELLNAAILALSADAKPGTGPITPLAQALADYYTPRSPLPPRCSGRKATQSPM
jgi:hypothetical protein